MMSDCMHDNLKRATGDFYVCERCKKVLTVISTHLTLECSEGEHKRCRHPRCECMCHGVRKK